MLLILLVPPALQALAMAFDELVFHRRRGLPRWERWGHPIDTLSTALCYGWLVSRAPDAPHALAGYVALCVASCLLITKDELVHAQLCEPAEGWLHSVLFVLHPVVFLCFWLLWQAGEGRLVQGALLLTLGVMFYQLVYWIPAWSRSKAS